MKGFLVDYADEFDFCMVFPVDINTGDFTDKGKGYTRTLKKLGFEMFAFKGMRPDKEIFVLIRSSLHRLRHYAEQIEFRIKLDNFKTKEKLELGDSERNIPPIKIPHNIEVTDLDPYQHIYGRYSTEIDESIYYRESGFAHPFRELVRLKLDAMILESNPSSGQNLKIQRYLRNGSLLGCYPLHNRAKTQALATMWKQFPRQKLPLFHIKEYFGEKVAMYFAFTEHFLLFLCTPAIIGFPMQIYIFASGDYSAVFLPFFSFFISLWAVIMLEYWKRKEKGIALEWGTIEFELNEIDRPDFKGEKIQSFIDGSQIYYFSSTKRSFYICQSITAVVLLIFLVVGIVVTIYVIRFAITPSVGVGNAQTIASLANAIQIQILNYIYSLIANALTERENHRTETQFEDSMIAKIFMFQFINSYASFFYLAFIAELVNDCPEDGCMPILAINLAIIFGTRMIVGKIIQLVIPYLIYKYKYKKVLEKANGKMSRPEKEYLLDPYNQSSVSLEDYADIAITYGYMAMFVTALPGAALAALLSLALEVQADGWKLLNLHQRPFPKGCEDIGSWQNIFLLISIIAVVTNAGITVYTMTTLDHFSVIIKFWVFILFQWVCFTMQAIIMEAIPDVPEYIEIQLQRADFIVRKLIEQESDKVTNDLNINLDPVMIQHYPLNGDKESTPNVEDVAKNPLYKALLS